MEAGFSKYVIINNIYTFYHLAMRLSRLYLNSPLSLEQDITLPQDSAHYLLNVLRLRVGASIILFNGQGGEYLAYIISLVKKNVRVHIIEFKDIERESTLQLTLVQAISRPEHMDYTLQKAVELGVQHIVPVITERSPPFAKNKIEKREQRWQKHVISASEQCGRNRLPHLHPVQTLQHWLMKPQQGTTIILSPTGQKTITNVVQEGAVSILIGAEGGFNQIELQQAMQSGYVDVRLGARILRTETAAVTMLAICQTLWGDLH
ncbi:MAG: 16S rRNA (uracil(1498)-N(3))-methyltransferase [Thiomargarita sp.]|nr:16S rRNA (uracil(1498)-N(3))-methyltransferase [Thiomargarita sp.]